MFYVEFVFFLGGSPASSAIDDNLDVFNEKMGQIFNLSWVVRNFLQTPPFIPTPPLINSSHMCRPPRLFQPPAYSGLKSTHHVES